MIYFDGNSNKWVFHRFIAMYDDSSTGENVTRVEYITNRRYLEERVSKWPSFSNLVIQQFTPSVLQQARMSDINAAHVDQNFEVYVSQYIQYGYIDSPLDDQGVPVDTGNSYINTLVGRAENQQRILDAARQRLIEKTAYLRWKHEIQGVWIDDMLFGTTDREKGLLTSKVVIANLSPGAQIDYKTRYCWINVPSEDMIAIGKTVDNFVQACFTHERVLTEQILVTEDLSTIDVTTGWPDNHYTLDLA